MAKAPGKSHREGLTLLQVADMFKDELSARTWIESLRWTDGPFCPHCGSLDVQSDIKHKSMTHRCRDCQNRPMFTVRTGTILENTRLKYSIWAIGIYLYTTNIKGISSMRLHREVGITQKSAWFMLHRLRAAFESGSTIFSGPVEVDETYIGGKEKNKHGSKKLKAGRGAVGKVAVVGVKDRQTNRVSASVVKSTDRETLQSFVTDHTANSCTVYTDEHKSYQGLPRAHQTVKHSAKEYVNGMAHTNGIESFWALFKRGYHGTYHHMSEKHLDRYVKEFAGRHNIRGADTIDQMGLVVTGMERKRLKYKELIA